MVESSLLTEVKHYLRVDGEDDDNLIGSLTDAADQYIKNATRQDVDTTLELYETALKMLVANWYENRDPVGKADSIAFSLESMLIQLSHCGSEL